MSSDTPSCMHSEEELGRRMVGGEGVIVVMAGGEVDVRVVGVMVEVGRLFEGVVVSTACPGEVVEEDGGSPGVVMDEAIVAVV